MFDSKAPIGDAPHNYGFDYHGLIRVVRACDSKEAKRRWAAIRIYTANGDYIDIDATARKVLVTHHRKGDSKAISADDKIRACIRRLSGLGTGTPDLSPQAIQEAMELVDP